MTKFNVMHCGLLAAILVSGIFLMACDRVVEEKSKTTQGPDGTSVQTEKVVEHNDGTVTVDKESHVTKP